MCSEDADRPAQHRFPADPCILFRDVAAGARAAPGSDDHRGAGAALPMRWGIPVGSHGAAHITDPARFHPALSAARPEPRVAGARGAA